MGAGELQGDQTEDHHSCPRGRWWWPGPGWQCGEKQLNSGNFWKSVPWGEVSGASMLQQP